MSNKQPHQYEEIFTDEVELTGEQKEIHAWIRSYIGEDAPLVDVLRSQKVLGDLLENLLAIQGRIDKEQAAAGRLK